MKCYDKILLILILSTTNFLISQAPSQFTYQSVVRTNSGSLVSNQEVSFRFTILKGTKLGSIVFEEEHTVTTNINGLATMIIGKGSGTDDLSEIDWGIDSYFLKVEVDPEGGFNYIAEDTTQLLSVPFALYSNSSGSNLKITGQDYLSINNNELTVNKIDLSDDVDGILPIANGGTGSSTAPMVTVITALDAAAARNVLELSTVASSGSYNDLTDRLTAGTNIDITDGVISSTDTNTTYTAGTGIAIDGNNAISTTVTDTDTVRSVTAGGNTLADSETLAFTAGSNVTITENAGAVTISSTDTNTTYTAGTGIAIDGNNAISSTITQYTDSNAQAAFTAGTNIDITDGVISSTDTNTTYTAGTGIAIDGNNAISTTVTDTDTVRSVTAGGNTLADSETLAFTAGSNVTITENAGAVTISSTDTNTTYTAGTGIAIDGNNAISTTVTDTDTVRSVTAGGNTLADSETLAFTAGSNVTITENAGAVTISSTDTNTTYTAGTGIAIDGNNAISSTITQYTDSNAQAAFTAGTNIDITDGVISSTDTNTTYTAGTGIAIDGNNAISTTVTDTDTVRSVTAGGNTLADSETLAFTAGSNVTITENAGAVTISSTDTNTTYSVGDGGLTQNNFTDALKSKLDDLKTSAIYDDSGSPALENGITAAEIRSLIGVDASGSDNSTNVTLAGSYDYLTLSGQEITLDQITNDDLAGSIADSKLNQITTADKVAGSSVQLASGSALANSSGLNVTVDDSSIENNSGTLRVKANGISNTMIEDQELKEIAGLTPAGTGNYNFIVGTNDAFTSVNSGNEVIEALGVKSGTYTWQDNSTDQETLTISGVVSTSVVVATFQSGDNGRVIKYVTPGSGNITFKLSGTPATGAKIMYIIIK